jgi:hypothetical protein
MGEKKKPVFLGEGFSSRPNECLYSLLAQVHQQRMLNSEDRDRETRKQERGVNKLAFSHLPFAKSVRLLSQPYTFFLTNS